MKQKAVKIDHQPEQPQVYVVVHNHVNKHMIDKVYTSKIEALEDAGDEEGWIVITRDLEVGDAPS